MKDNWIMHKVMTKKLRSISLALFVILNIYGGFLETQLGISRQVFIMIPIFFLAICVLINKKIIVNKNILTLFLFILCICVMQLLFMANTEIFSILFYGLILVFASINYDSQDLWLVCKTIVFVSIFMIIETFFYYFMLLDWGWGTYNVRNFTAAPKEDYTIILSLAFIILFVLFLSNKFGGVKKYGIIFLMLLELFVNIVIMQSKTAMLLPIIILAFIYSKSSVRIKKTIRRICIMVLLALVLIFVFGQEYVPEYIYVFINNYTGLFEDKVSLISNVERFSGSYDQRSSIYRFCFELFLRYPILGVGFGQLGDYTILSSDAYVNELTQAESGVVSAFVEGGIFYGIMYLGMMLYLIIRSFRMIKRSSNSSDTYLLFFLAITLFLCCVTNDCQSITFWLMLGLLYSHKDKLNIMLKKGIVNSGTFSRL